MLWTFAEFRANRTLKVKLDHPRRLHLRLRSQLQGWLRLLCGKVWQCHPLTTRSWVIQCDSFRVGFATSPCSAFGASSSRNGYPHATRDKRRLQRPRLTQIHMMWDDGEGGTLSCRNRGNLMVLRVMLKLFLGVARMLLSDPPDRANVLEGGGSSCHHFTELDAFAE